MLSVIIPTYNERDNMEPLVRGVAQALRLLGVEGEIVVVDDNSPDGTGAEVERLAAHYPLRLVSRATERGLATAVMRGFDAARGDVIAVMDADLSHPPESLVDMYLTLMARGADMVVGSRFVKDGGTENWSRKRAFISLVARLFSVFLSPFKDNTSGFFMFRRQILEGARLRPVGYKIFLEMLVKTRAQSVVEEPILFRDRTRGQSKLTARTTLDYLRHLAALFRYVLLEAGHGREVGVTVTFARFSLVGLFGVGVNYGLFALLHHALGVHHLAAAALAIEISIIGNFLLNNFWTWRRRVRPGLDGLLARAARYHAVAGLAAFGGNWCLLWLLRDGLGVDMDAAYLAGIAVGMIVNFLLNDRWTFARTLWEGRRI